MQAIIPLCNGMSAVVDAGDFERVAALAWSPKRGNSGVWYAQATIPGSGRGSQKRILMHRMILDFPLFDVDHRDRNGLNNCRHNLRPTSQSTNQANKTRGRRCRRSQFKGVSFVAASCRWRAQISCNGNRRHLGVFDTERDAAVAYDIAALELFGEFACLNFPKSTT
jgi:hypothetical protein